MKKKSTAKLVVRRETLRAMSNMDLARAVGGGDVVLFDSGDKNCPALAIPQPRGD
jgi:hypothetical protein